MLDVGSMASLAPTGPITRTGAPGGSHAAAANTPTSAPLQTFRIHAGRVSTSCAPPADVMPLRLSDTTPTSTCMFSFWMFPSKNLRVAADKILNDSAVFRQSYVPHRSIQI